MNKREIEESKGDYRWGLDPPKKVCKNEVNYGKI